MAETFTHAALLDLACSDRQAALCGTRVSDGWIRYGTAPASLLTAVVLFVGIFVASALGQLSQAPKKITIVTDDNYPPYIFRDDTGRLQGITVDLWRAWEKKTGVVAEIHGMDWGMAVERMKKGEFDVLDTVFMTPERSAYLDFSKPYATIPVPIFFRAAISGVKDLASLKGFPVAARTGDADIRLLQKGGIAPLQLYNNYEAIITAAQERKVNVFVADPPPMLYFLHKYGLEADFRMSAPITQGQLHRAVRKGDAALLLLIEKGFQEVGKVEAARIERHWFGQTLASSRQLRRLGYGAMVAAALVVLLIGWSWVLRGQVQKRTHALRVSEEQLRLYAEHSPAAIAMLDRDLRYLVVSRRWMQDYRLGEDSVVGRRHYDLFPEVPPHWKAIHQRCLAGEVVKCDEEAFLRSDGRTDWIRWEIQPWRQADGSIGGVIFFTEDITARKQAQELLREGETRLIQAFRRTPVALIIGRMRDQQLVEVNEAFASLLGWARDEAVGRTLMELAVLDEAAARALRQASEKSRSVRDMELVVRSRHGGVLEVIASLETIEFQGEPHVVVTFVDITGRKRTEAQLAKVSADLGRAQSISHIGSWEYSAADGSIQWSDELYRIFGLPPQSVALSYEKLLAMVHPEDRSAHDAYQAQLLSSRPGTAIAPFEYRALRADGHVVHVMVKVEIQYDEHGRSACCFGTVQDITERKRADEALRESEATFAAAFENAPIGKAIVATDGRFLRVNRVLCEIVGYSEAELLAASFQDITHQDDLGLDIANVQKMLRHEMQSYQMEKRYLHKNGAVVWALLSVAMVDDEQGVPAFFVSQIQDISERKRSDLRIQQLNRLYVVLSSINETIVREKSAEALLTASCTIAVEKGLFGMAWIGLLDAETGRLQITAHFGASEETLAGLAHRISHSESSCLGCAVTAHALKTGEASICNDIAHDALAVGWREDALRQGYLSMAALPLKIGDKTIGVFNLYAATAEFFDADEISLLNELAADIGFALGVSRRESELREADKRFIRQRKTLIELTRHLGREAEDALLLLRKIAEGAALTLSASRVSIWRYNSDHSTIRCVDLFEWEVGRHSSGDELSAQDYPDYFLALADLEMISADDALTDPSTRCFADSYLKPHGIRSMLDVSIVVGGVRTGVLCIEHVRTPRKWTADEKTFALAMSNLVSLALESVERKQAEASLRESEKRFRQFAETIEEVFWMTDPTGAEMIYVSPAYETIWNRTCASLYADPSSWLEAVHPDDRERISKAAAFRRTRGEYDERFRILRPDGSLRWIHDRAFPVRDSHGNVLRIVGTAEDITESKQVEAQLLRSQRMESIGTLAGGIAHDLNNVLTPIMISIELLKLHETSPKRLDILSSIESSARRGADMVQQVLSFARGVEGRQLAVNVGRLLREIEKIADETFLKNIRVQCHVQPDVWGVQGDPTQLHQVLLNLCVNARDAMPGGGILRLSASNVIMEEQAGAVGVEARSGPHVLIEVEDTGAGMPPEVQERIFEPFFTTKDLGKGTGLGLSTSLAIIQGHHGFLRVHSQVGKGTTFQIYLPANDVASAQESGPVEPGISRGNGELVLVVDDEDSVREILRHTLEAFDYRVLLAADGVEASTLFSARQGEIAVVLTDMMMPVMDGLATIQVLKRVNPGVQIIAASGLGSKEMVAKASEAGVKHFIPKPYTAETLLKTLAQVLKA